MILMTKAKDWIDKRTDGVVAKAFNFSYCIRIRVLSRQSEWVLLLLFAVVCCCCLFSGAVFLDDVVRIREALRRWSSNPQHATELLLQYRQRT